MINRCELLFLVQIGNDYGNKAAKKVILDDETAAVLYQKKDSLFSKVSSYIIRSNGTIIITIHNTLTTYFRHVHLFIILKKPHDFVVVLLTN